MRLQSKPTCIECNSDRLSFEINEFYGWIECLDCHKEYNAAEFWDRTKGGDNNTLRDEAWGLYYDEVYINGEMLLFCQSINRKSVRERL